MEFLEVEGHCRHPRCLFDFFPDEYFSPVKLNEKRCLLDSLLDSPPIAEAMMAMEAIVNINKIKIKHIPAPDTTAHLIFLCCAEPCDK